MTASLCGACCPATFDCAQLPDPDDGREVVKGKVIAGNLDHFRDVDWFSISLEEGETVEVTTDSLNVDTVWG